MQHDRRIAILLYMLAIITPSLIWYNLYYNPTIHFSPLPSLHHRKVDYIWFFDIPIKYNTHGLLLLTGFTLLCITVVMYFTSLPHDTDDLPRRTETDPFTGTAVPIFGQKKHSTTGPPIVSRGGGCIGSATVIGIALTLLGLVLTYQANYISQQITALERRQSLPLFRIYYGRSDGSYVPNITDERLDYHNFGFLNAGGLARQAVVTCSAFLRINVQTADDSWPTERFVPIHNYCEPNVLIPDVTDRLIVISRKDNGKHLLDFSHVVVERLEDYLLTHQITFDDRYGPGFSYHVYFRIIYQDFAGKERTEYYQIAVWGYDRQEYALYFNGPAIFSVISETEGEKIFEAYDNWISGPDFALNVRGYQDDSTTQRIDDAIMNIYDDNAN